MKCFICGSDVHWGGDEDYEDGDGGVGIESNYSCNNCRAFYIVTHSVENEDEENDLG